MSDSGVQLYTLINSSPEYKTVYDYTHDYNSGVFQFAGDEDGFLNIKDELSVSNRQRLLDSYTPAELILYELYPAKDMPMRLGVKFVVPADKVDRNELLTKGLSVVSNNDVAFKANALAEIESDPGYTHVEKRSDGNSTNAGITKESCPEMTVWLWCRSLSPAGGASDEMNGEIFDITPFIQNISTHVTKNGGNWQLTLPPLICELDVEGKWVIKKDSLMQYLDPKYTSLSNQGYVAHSSLHDENLKRNSFLFHNIISTNDLIYIRFETLGLEKDDRLSDKNNLYVNKNQIPGKVYDMIGLVDINSQSVTPSSNDGTISISGRDLSKLFIEDGTYFFTQEFFSGKNSQISHEGSVVSKNGLLERVYSDNASSFYNLWFNNSVEHVFQFVIKQLSNIKIIPDELLSAYDTLSSNKRSTVFGYGDAYKIKNRDQLLQQYEDASLLAIRNLRNSYGLTATAKFSEDFQVNEVYNAVTIFLKDIRLKKVRKVFENETNGWKAFTWNTPNGTTERIDENQIPNYFIGKLYNIDNTIDGENILNNSELIATINNIDSYLDISNSIGKYKKLYSENLASGIWQIVKLVIDKSVASRRLNDPSISSANGSLMNFFRKVVQEPFAEIFFDTYSDIYGITIRKPPTDQIGLISLIEGKVNSEDGRVINGKPVVIDIESEDVLKEDLYFDDGSVYSWYHLKPEATYIGDQKFTWAYLPALYFQEYADIWGSKPMDLSHKYMPYIPLDPKSSESDISLTQKQSILDLKFMIDSNMMNPFTRKGVLLLNGDRRIKVGNVLRYKATGEIFTIDAVKQDFKIGESIIDRTTLVYVSRGMVEQLIYGIPYKTGKNQELDHISYFNVINTNLNLKTQPFVEQKTVRKKVGTKVIPPTIIPMNPLYNTGSLEQLKSASFTTSNGVLIKNIGLEKLDKYQPEQKAKFIQFIFAINALNIMVDITSGVRSHDEQAVIYNSKKGAKIGKAAKAGGSNHETGNAIDINLLVRVPGKYVDVKRVRITDNASVWKSTLVPFIAYKLDIMWGGNFSDNYDPVHFQLKTVGTNSTSEDVFEDVVENVKTNVLDESAIFSNFKVNEHVFKFFLRREQLSGKYNVEQINRKLYKKDVKEALGE